jgi:nitroreductase
MKRQETKKIAEIEEIESVACAVQNMMLTATAYGVVAFWGSGGITYMEEAKPFFGLEADDKLLGYLYLGYPSVEIPDIQRKAIEEKVKWEL